MEKHERIRRWNILLAVIVVLLALACVFLIFSKQSDKAKANAEIMRERIQNDKSENEQHRKDFSFYNDYKIKMLRKEKIRGNELTELSDGRYGSLYISNTDSFFDGYWVNYFLGMSILVPKYKCDTPEMLSEYLEASVSDETLTDVFVEIDPYEMEQAYYAEHKYSGTKQTYMQMFQQAFWNCVGEHPEVKFHLLVPIRSLSVWDGYSLEEYTRRIDAWDQFIKFSSRYDNLIISCMATEEWLIANEELFDENGLLKSEYFGDIFAMELSYENYIIDYNNFGDIKSKLETALLNDSDNGYYRADFSERDIVFFGDSLFRKYSVEFKNVPGMIGALTNANTYNLSIGGTTATNNDAGTSFCDIVNMFLGNIEIKESLDENVVSALADFRAQSHDNRELTFVILYGFNDYANNVSLGNKIGNDTTTFSGALNIGISLLKEAYPDADIVLVSPLYTDYNNGGQKGFTAEGKSLLKYISAMEKCAEYNEASFVNLYSEAGIDSANSDKYLSDGIHPNIDGAYLISKCLIRHFLTEEQPEN